MIKKFQNIINKIFKNLAEFKLDFLLNYKKICYNIILNKLKKGGFMFIFIAVIFLVSILFYDKKGIPLFLYHNVNPKSNVTPELFEEHLKIIKDMNMKTITISDYYSKGAGLNTVLLTLDDGYYDNYKYVFPLLKKYNVRATIFLNTLYVKEKREIEPELKSYYDANYEAIRNLLQGKNIGTEDYMSWEEIKEMYDSGLVDFQAHSHKHTAMFVDKKVKGFTKKVNMDFTDLYLYGDIEDNYPVFNKRGEYTGKALKIKQEFFKNFINFYNNRLIELKNEKEKIKLAEKFIDENREYFSNETDKEYEDRISEDFIENKSLIEQHLGNKVQFFCWPWGHRGKNTIKILEKLGVKGFITTKKGTNLIFPNWKMIRRIELRDYNAKKFKINLRVARNVILGKIYGWLS